MKDVIEAGEYVRTKNGKIDKVVSNNCYMEKYIKAEENFIFCNSIVKHSKQLIDLIEVGDIVKYKLKNLKHTNVTTVRLVQDARSNKEKMKKICINSKLFEILRFVTEISYEIRRQ